MNVNINDPHTYTIASALAQLGQQTQPIAIETQPRHHDQNNLLVCNKVLTKETEKKLDLREEEKELVARDHANGVVLVGLVGLGNFKYDVVWEVEVVINMIRHAGSKIFDNKGTAFSATCSAKAELIQVFRAIILWSTRHVEEFKAIAENIEHVKRSLFNFSEQIEGHVLRMARKMFATHAFRYHPWCFSNHALTTKIYQSVATRTRGREAALHCLGTVL